MELVAGVGERAVGGAVEAEADVGERATEPEADPAAGALGKGRLEVPVSLERVRHGVARAVAAELGGVEAAPRAEQRAGQVDED